MASGAHHERLSSLDATFLGVEDRCSHMHIGSVGVFEGGPGGAIDLERVQHLVSVTLDGVPRYRQRVETIPLLGHPVWVDDASPDRPVLSPRRRSPARPGRRTPPSSR